MRWCFRVISRSNSNAITVHWMKEITASFLWPVLAIVLQAIGRPRQQGGGNQDILNFFYLAYLLHFLLFLFVLMRKGLVLGRLQWPLSLAIHRRGFSALQRHRSSIRYSTHSAGAHISLHTPQYSTMNLFAQSTSLCPQQSHLLCSTKISRASRQPMFAVKFIIKRKKRRKKMEYEIRILQFLWRHGDKIHCSVLVLPWRFRCGCPCHTKTSLYMYMWRTFSTRSCDGSSLAM